MRKLSTQERREWQQATLATAPRPWGRDARLQFWLEDLVFGHERTLPKFRARELIARSPTGRGSRPPSSSPAGSATMPSDVAPGYAPYESLADLFRQIGADEGLHKELSLARMAQGGGSTP
jgi:hypothetical protein